MERRLLNADPRTAERLRRKQQLDSKYELINLYKACAQKLL